MYETILQWIVDHSVPAPPPSTWHFLRPVPSIRALSGDPAALVASLLKEFSEEELVRVGILVRASGNERELTPVFRTTAPIKILSRHSDGSVCDIEHERGRLTPGDPAALRSLDDQLTREQTGDQNFVLATFSNFDLAVLSMLGFAVTPAYGLQHISGGQVRNWLKPSKTSEDVPQQADEAAQASAERPRIILVAFQLGALRNELPEGFVTVFRQLERIERAMRIDTESAIRIWVPGRGTLERIRDGVALADEQLVFNEVRKSLKCTLSIEEYSARAFAAAVEDIPRASRQLRAELTNAPTSPFGTRRLPTRLAALSRAVDVAVIREANRRVMDAANPLDKSLWIAAAQMMEMQFESIPLVQRTRAAIATDRADSFDKPIEDLFNLQLRIADGLIRIKKALAMNQ